MNFIKLARFILFGLSVVTAITALLISFARQSTSHSRLLAFSKYSPPNSYIYMTDAEGEYLRHFAGMNPSWSASGVQLTFYRDDDLYLFEQRIKLIAAPPEDCNLDAIWPPHGTQLLVYTRYCNDDRAGWAKFYDVETGNETYITRQSMIADPLWSPDGQHLSYFYNGSLYTLRVNRPPPSSGLPCYYNLIEPCTLHNQAQQRLYLPHGIGMGMDGNFYLINYRELCFYQWISTTQLSVVTEQARGDAGYGACPDSSVIIIALDGQVTTLPTNPLSDGGLGYQIQRMSWSPNHQWMFFGFQSEWASMQFDENGRWIEQQPLPIALGNPNSLFWSPTGDGFYAVRGHRDEGYSLYHIPFDDQTGHMGPISEPLFTVPIAPTTFNFLHVEWFPDGGSLVAYTPHAVIKLRPDGEDQGQTIVHSSDSMSGFDWSGPINLPYAVGPLLLVSFLLGSVTIFPFNSFYLAYRHS